MKFPFECSSFPLRKITIELLYKELLIPTVRFKYTLFTIAQSHNCSEVYVVNGTKYENQTTCFAEDLLEKVEFDQVCAWVLFGKSIDVVECCFHFFLFILTEFYFMRCIIWASD